MFRYPNGQPNGTPSVYAPNGNDGGRHVCELYDNGQLDANAHLIAAAPDLLASLRAIIGSGELVGRAPQRMIDNAVAAIAKAEGRVE